MARESARFSRTTAPRADARVSGAHEHEERASGAEAPPGEGPQASDRQQRIASRRAGSARFRPDERIRRRAEFQQIYEQGVRLHGRFSTLFVLPNQRRRARWGSPRRRSSAARSQRNRAKRLIREVFRRNKIAPGFDVVVVPERELLDASLTVLEADYRATLERRLRQRR